MLTEGISNVLNCSIAEICTAMERKGLENVLYLILFLFRGEVPAASAEFHGETLPGV